MKRIEGFIAAAVIAAIGFYIISNKPDCREGFVPLMSFGQGWYCAAGYKPQY